MNKFCWFMCFVGVHGVDQHATKKPEEKANMHNIWRMLYNSPVVVNSVNSYTFPKVLGFVNFEKQCKKVKEWIADTAFPASACIPALDYFVGVTPSSLDVLPPTSTSDQKVDVKFHCEIVHHLRPSPEGFLARQFTIGKLVSKQHKFLASMSSMIPGRPSYNSGQNAITSNKVLAGLAKAADEYKESMIKQNNDNLCTREKRKNKQRDAPTVNEILKTINNMNRNIANNRDHPANLDDILPHFQGVFYAERPDGQSVDFKEKKMNQKAITSFSFVKTVSVTNHVKMKSFLEMVQADRDFKNRNSEDTKKSAGYKIIAAEIQAEEKKVADNKIKAAKRNNMRFQRKQRQ